MKNEVKRLIESMIRKGKRALKSAEEHIKNGDYDFASSKAYYAVFHLMQAAFRNFRKRVQQKHWEII